MHVNTDCLVDLLGRAHNSDLAFSDGDCRTRDMVTICNVTVYASVTN
jgi:hypothetical protein